MLGGPASVVGDVLVDDVLGGVVGGAPVRDRSMPAEDARLLREWFGAPEDRSAHGDAGPVGAPAPAPAPAPDDRRTAAAAAWSAPLQELVTGVAAVRSQVVTELPGPQAVAEAQVLLQQLELLRSVVLAGVADVDVRQLHTRRRRAVDLELARRAADQPDAR